MVEDDEEAAGRNEAALREDGVSFTALRVTERESFEKALEEFQPDIILSDFDLPAFDGATALEIARSRVPDVPFIFVTGPNEEEQATGMLKRGATDYVLKDRLPRLVPAVLRAIAESARRDERNEVLARLKRSEERYRTIFEATGTAMFTMDRFGAITVVNAEFERMTGLAAEDVKGKVLFSDLLTEDEVETESFNRQHEDLLAERVKSPVHFEAVMKLGPGDVLNVLGSMALLAGTSASIVSLIDVSREKAYEEQLEERAGRLREFLTIASHELRQPITIIQGYTATLNQFVTQLSPESVREIYQSMNSSAERLTRIVEELMDVNRIERQEIDLQRRECELSGVIAATVQAMHSRGAASEFSVATTGVDRPISIDPERISQCLMSLLENAVNFSPDSSSIDITADLWHDMLEVRVMDRGPGVPEGAREKVFERFYQIEEVLHHSRPGIGLGLYIAHEIVSAHGGTITCEERPGGGAIFRFNIPC